jgi:Tfp pilus assembly protein PilP
MNMTATAKILICVLAAGSALAQNPSIIQNTRNTMNAVSNNTTAASNEALGIHQSAPPASSSHTHAAVKASATAAATPAKVSVVAVKGKGKSETKKVPTVAIRPVVAPKASVLVTQNKTNANTSAKTNAKTNDKSKDKPSATQNVAAHVSAAPAAEERADKDTSLAPDSKYAANGRRDPFISPVVSHANGSSCTSGKKCLEIGTINLRGVVHGESGFIAVVSNGLNKAYFLRENDPVFNGYVMKITGDSIVFQETLQDRLGKSFTREVVKKITTPAV